MKQKYRRSVFIVTYSIHHGRINYLILKRKWHWRGWEFPKGGIEDGEKMINAVKRETLEETGKAALQIKRYEIYGRYKYKKTLPDRPGFIGQSYVLFSAQIPFGEIKIGREHKRYLWLNFEDALGRLSWKDQKECLKVADKNLRKIYKL